MQAFLRYLIIFPTGLPKKYLENEYLTADSAILTNSSDSGSDPLLLLSPAAQHRETWLEEKQWATQLHQVHITVSIYITLWYSVSTQKTRQQVSSLL